MPSRIQQLHDEWCRDNGYDMTEHLCNYRLHEKSYKPQAASDQKPQATSLKRQARKATSRKLQATSNKRLDS